MFQLFEFRALLLFRADKTNTSLSSGAQKESILEASQPMIVPNLCQSAGDYHRRFSSMFFFHTELGACLNQHWLRTIIGHIQAADAMGVIRQRSQQVGQGFSSNLDLSAEQCRQPPQDTLEERAVHEPYRLAERPQLLRGCLPLINALGQYYCLPGSPN